MKCPECLKAGKRSRVTMGPGTTTLMYSAPFYGEDGRYHDHDPNSTATRYSCSEGHTWVGTSRPRCWCGWPDE